MKINLVNLSLATIVAINTPYAFAKIYLTPNNAAQVLVGESINQLTKINVELDKATLKAMSKYSGIRHAMRLDNIYKNANGDWFIIDEVLGKHEFITFAIAIAANGAVKHIEVLEYRESYGHQVREKSWLDNFTGKTIQASLEVTKDIPLISGATLSSQHITQGVRRALYLHQAVLSKK